MEQKLGCAREKIEYESDWCRDESVAYRINLNLRLLDLLLSNFVTM